MSQRSTIVNSYLRLVLSTIMISILCILLTQSLKYSTEHLQEIIYHKVGSIHPILFIVLPSIGITAIYFLRKYAFKNRKNKGITEIYKTLDDRKDHLPFFKTPSHYINGFLTVIFGGSTGIEVSTVVATASVGNTVFEKSGGAKKYKRELICAGVTAGVAILFASPFVGFLFAIEVIARKIRPTIILSCVISAIVSWFFLYYFAPSPFFSITVSEWAWYAIPFFLLLSVLGGVLSVYFTMMVIKVKSFFYAIENNFIRVNLGAITVGIFIFLLPVLYGDSYHGLIKIVESASQNKELTISVVVLALLVVTKPLVASLTLGAGGDGGVFAPSIVAGAFLGLLFAYGSNELLGTNLDLFNFVLAGAAATLSASIFAPFTSIVLICNLAPNGIALLFPIALCCFTAKYFAQWLLPYNVYTYDFYLASKSSTEKC